MNALEEKLYTPAEAAPILHVKTPTIWERIRKGQIKALPGRKRLIPESELVRWRTAK
jgi:excisionase family DNA binding protein